MSLLIGIHVSEVAGGDPLVAEKCGDRIYPLVIPAGVPEFPFIVFERGGVRTEGTKDGDCADRVSVSVMVVAKRYAEATLLAHTLRYRLTEYPETDYDRFAVLGCEFVDSREEYLEDADAYAVTLDVDFVTIDKY